MGKGIGIKKGQRQCQGCLKFVPYESFPPGCIYCPEDKKAVQNLKNIAIRDGDLEWFEEQMASAHSRKALLKKYHDKVGDMERNRKAGARKVLP